MLGLLEKHQPSGDTHGISTNPSRRGDYLQRHLLMELGMRKKALVFWITQLFSIQHHCCSVSTELLVFTTSKWSEKNSEELELCLQKIKTQYGNNPVHLDMNKPNFKKKLVQLTKLCLQRVGAHPGGARACGLCCLTFNITFITFSTTVLVCSDQALFSQASPALFMNEKSQIHTVLLLPSPQHFLKNTSGTSKENTWEWLQLVEEQEAQTVDASGQSSELWGMHSTQSQAEGTLQ